MHGGFGPGGLLVVIAYAVVVCIPIGKILGRVGFSGWWSLLAVVPLLNVILLWVFAFTDWPNLPKRAN